MNVKITEVPKDSVQATTYPGFSIVKMFDVAPGSAWIIWNGSYFEHVENLERITVPFTSTPSFSWLLQEYVEKGAINGDVTIIHIAGSSWGHTGCFFPAR